LTRDIDVIYVANLSPIKRVHVYLRALGEIVARRGSVRAALVLSSWGGDQRTFDELLELYSLRRHVSVFMNLSQSALNELLNRSKLSVLLSRKEGSNKTLFESMFSNTPVLLIKDNIGVNKDYINQHTGMLVDDRDLPAAIERFMDGPTVLAPRAWAMDNIAPELSTHKLQVLLDELYPKDTIATAPLWPKVNSPEATYMDPSLAATLPHIADTLECFSLRGKTAATEQSTRQRMRELYRVQGASS
jgi:glycosyltransferase involved in cell wall biosynthesis